MSGISTHLPPISDLKAQARRLRTALVAQGQRVSHSATLELVAQAHGQADWNTAAARAPQRADSPRWTLGQRVSGHYLGHPFAGRILGLQAKGAGRLGVTIAFDTPVDTVRSPHFSNLRRRVSATIGPDGQTVETTSDGTPHLRLAA